MTSDLDIDLYLSIRRECVSRTSVSCSTRKNYFHFQWLRVDFFILPSPIPLGQTTLLSIMVDDYCAAASCPHALEQRWLQFVGHSV
jgi:hypothetical protein